MSLARKITLFEGEFDVDAKGIGKLTPEDNYMEDYILRVEGLQRSIYNHQLLIWALDGTTEANRKKYIAAKKIDLNKIATNIETIFKMEFQRWLEAGYTQDSAKKKALNFARQYKQDSLKQHNKQFPESIDYNECMRMLNVEKKVSKKEKSNNAL